MTESSTVTCENDREAIATELRRRGDEPLRLAEYEAKKSVRGFLKGASAAFHEAAKLVTAAPPSRRGRPPVADRTVRCACQRRDPYDCWRLRYPRAADDDEATAVRMEGGPCDCPCHDEFACEDEGDWL